MIKLTLLSLIVFTFGCADGVYSKGYTKKITAKKQKCSNGKMKVSKKKYETTNYERPRGY